MRKAVAGFTVIELLMVIVIVGIMMAVAIPFFRTASQKSSARGAGDEIARLYATARAVSIQRGKLAWLVLDPSTSTALVVASKVTGTGVDTVSQPDNLGTRYRVTFTTSTDSLVFTPRGIGANLSTTTVILTSAAGGYADTVVIYPTGKVSQ
jgi:prepilin-type N-terminal cleavage/methylation domain-containing protein